MDRNRATRWLQRAAVVSLAALALPIAWIFSARLIGPRYDASYRQLPIATRGAELLHDFSVAARGGLVATPSGTSLSIGGKSTDASARIELFGAAQRLTPERFALRYQASDRADYDLSVGFADGNGHHHVQFGLENGATPHYALRGDTGPPPFTLALDKNWPARGAPSDEHELELRFAPDLYALLCSVDGDPQAAAIALWLGGTPVRPRIALAARASDVEPHAEIRSFRREPLDSTDHRDADDITSPTDAKRLRVLLHSDSEAHRTDDGYLLRGRSDLLVAAASRPLGALRWSARVSLGSLHNATVNLGVSNLSGAGKILSDWPLPTGAGGRKVLVGFGDENGARPVFIAGHFDDPVILHGETQIVSLAEKDIALVIEVDAWRERVRLTIGDHTVERPLALRAGEWVVPFFAVDATAEGASFELNVRAIELRTLQRFDPQAR